MHNVLKLTPTNYLSWKLQVEALLVGHDVFSFLDGSTPCPSPTLITNDVESPNPDFAWWTRQDRLLFGSLIGTIDPNLVPLINQAKTSAQLWDKLYQTYALPSRGHIKQLRDKFHRIIKGPSSISDYMRSLKECADHLAALGKPIDHEDFIDRVLAGLDDSYKSVIDSVNGRDTPISFEELHEKLINKELSIFQTQSTMAPALPATAFAAYTKPQHRPSPSRPMVCFPHPPIHPLPVLS
ncbi:uncharacterized protein LOC110711399 [Chenopodium quinoa]|uniref:uncharacterized protein LOC110711399 n=1 Tax=Chenopodium quinoa TaxID=63459 RepID=UPI000B77E3EC|nr:uncharacterized protein LOC110711399 [Chenopodium quinoa]